MRHRTFEILGSLRIIAGRRHPESVRLKVEMNGIEKSEDSSRKPSGSWVRAKIPLDRIYLEDIMLPGRLGRMIKKLREAKGLTQVQLAERAQIGQGYLAQLEGGIKKNPSLAVLKRLARAVGVPGSKRTVAVCRST